MAKSLIKKSRRSSHEFEYWDEEGLPAPSARWVSVGMRSVSQDNLDALVQKAHEKAPSLRDQLAAEQAAVIPLLRFYQKVRGIPWYIVDEEIFLHVDGDAVEAWGFASMGLRNIFRRRHRPEWCPLPLVRIPLAEILWEPRNHYVLPNTAHTFWWKVRQDLIRWATIYNIDISPWLTQEERWRKMQDEMRPLEVDE